MGNITREQVRELQEQAASIPSKISKCVSLEPEEAMNLYRILHKIMDGFK